jgi:choline-sulfatase
MTAIWRRGGGFFAGASRPIPHRCLVLVLVATGLAMGAGCKRGPVDDLASAIAAAEKIGGPGLNVLLISVDTTRADHVACYGHPTVKTPNIDRLAAEGTRFAQCISSIPLTLPSHTTMLTGSYQFVHGVRDNGSYSVAPENETLAEIFKEAGYVTHAQVATAILDLQYRLDQGFDTYQEVPNRKHAGHGEPFAFPRQTDRKADDITREGIRLLKQNRYRKFFIFLHYYDPHLPYAPPERFARQYESPYLGEIAFFDEQFGLLMDEVRALELGRNTLVILVSDHGEGLTDHDEPTHSFFLYDTTQHVPLIIWGPKFVPAGQVVESQVRMIDLASTIVDFADLEPSAQMQGTSLLPLLVNPQLDLQLPAYADAFGSRFNFGYSPLRFVRDQGWKYILCPKPILFNVAEDPGELANLVDREPERAAKMKEQLFGIIADSPKPPSSRSTDFSATSEQIAELEALGYFGAGASTANQLVGEEVDDFEPQGKDPHENKEAFRLLGDASALRSQGDHEGAAKLYRELLKLEPECVRAIQHLATAMAALDQNEEAIRLFKRAIELEPQSGEPCLRLAVFLSSLGKEYLADTERYYRRAIELDGESGSAHLGLAHLLNTSKGTPKDVKEAVKEYALADVLRPDDADVLHPWGLALHKLARLAQAAEEKRKLLAEAEEKLRRACRLSPDLRRARSILGVVLYDEGKIDLAIEQFELLANSSRDDIEAHRRLVICYVNQGELANACTHLRHVVELEPEDIEARIELGRILTQMGKLEEALRTYEDLLRHAPDNGPVCGETADLLDQLGRRNRAVEFLRDGLERIPGDPTVTNDLAWRLATSPVDGLRDGPEAVRLAEQVNQITGGENAAILDTLAASYAETGRFQEAVATARRAREIAQNKGEEALRKQIESHLARYENHQPVRE